MLRNLACRYDNEYDIYRISWEGLTTPEDVRAFWLSILEEVPPQCEGFLVDQNDVEFNNSFAAYKVVTDVFVENTNVFGNRRIAVLVDSPKLLAEFVMMQRKSGGAVLKPFSDEDVAIKWILT
ncbi:MAG: hypothetical protein ACK5JS_02330 [Mangrovibacterium sp.]